MQIDRSHYTLLLSISASLFCTPLMVAGVNAILPELGNGLDAGVTQLSLIGTVYSLGLAIFQLACGSLGDIYGHRRIFLFGALLFAISGAILGSLSSISVFLGLRLAQGAGGAMLSASGLALLTASATPENRTAYLGLSGAAVYSGIACGPPIAGFVTGFFGWRWIFWANALASLVVFLLMKYTVSQEWRPNSRQKYDWPGLALYSVAMTALTFAATEVSKHVTLAWICLAGFIVFLTLFCLRELRCRFPILNLRLLARNTTLTLSCLAAFVNYASFFGIIFYFAIYLQAGKGMSVEAAGLILALQPLMQALSTPVAHRTCERFSTGIAAGLGAALCGTGLLFGAFLELSSSIWLLIFMQFLLGCGMSFFALGNTAIIMESAGKKNIGQASGLTGAVRTVGQLCGMAIITLTLSVFLGNQPVTFAVMDGFMYSMKVNLAVFGILNIAAVGLTLFRNHVRKSGHRGRA